MQTLEQKRAQYAWETSKEYSDEQINLVKGLPALIMNSGLMQVMAVLEAKPQHKLVGEDLRRWLNTRFQNLPVDFKDFMNELFLTNSQNYQEVTKESLAWLRWLRQMAQAHGVKK